MHIIPRCKYAKLSFLFLFRSRTAQPLLPANLNSAFDAFRGVAKKLFYDYCSAICHQSNNFYLKEVCDPEYTVRSLNLNFGNYYNT